MLDYYKETMKQYYKKFNVPEPKIEIVIVSNFDFDARCQIENIKFDSANKRFNQTTERI